MSTLPRILICGNYGATNLGDEAILSSILQFARATFPDARFTVVSSNPSVTSKKHGVESVKMIPAGVRSLFSGGLGESLRAYRDADLVLFGGGGLFSDEKPRAIFIWFMQILPALLRRKKVFCFGQSVGPLRSSWSRTVVSWIFKKFQTVVVRDEASRELLSALNVRNVQVLPDPVFGFQKAISTSERKPYIVLSLRPWRGEGQHAVLAKFVDWIFETYHLRTFLVPFQSRVDDDALELQKVFSLLENREAAEKISYTENISEVVQLMREATAVVGMRLHSLIFSTLAATPFLALSYSQKVSEVVRQLGMENFLCSYHALDLEDFKKKFAKLYEERTQIQKMLHEKQQKFYDDAQKYERLLSNSSAIKK